MTHLIATDTTVGTTVNVSDAGVPLQRISDVIRLQPSGAQFSAPFSLTLYFDPRTHVAPRVVVCNDAVNACEVFTGTATQLSSDLASVTIMLSHFSLAFLVEGMGTAADAGVPADGPVSDAGGGGSTPDAGAVSMPDSGAVSTPDAGRADASPAPQADAGSVTRLDGPSDAAAPTTGSDGCSCRTGSGRTTGNAGLLLVVGLVGLALRRRRKG